MLRSSKLDIELLPDRAATGGDFAYSLLFVRLLDCRV